MFVALNAPLYPRFDHEDFRTFLGEFELTTEKKLSELSYGQKKKFLIAFGLASRCRLLLMDEPTNGLDIPSKSQFRRLLARAGEHRPGAAHLDAPGPRYGEPDRPDHHSR